jgi:cytochrome c-type biogenesis protein CcmH
LTAQDLTNFLTPDVARVGSRLACRCGGCKETVGNCPMIGCGSADPLRRRIYGMQGRGMSDDAIVKQIVQEQGIVALAGQQPLPWIAWLMPGIALLLGFAVYSVYVKRNRKQAGPMTAADAATLERYRVQIEDELER